MEGRVKKRLILGTHCGVEGKVKKWLILGTHCGVEGKKWPILMDAFPSFTEEDAIAPSLTRYLA